MNAYFGQGTGPVLIGYVSCTGNEHFLAHCINSGIGVTSSWCNHNRDAGVQCPGTIKSRANTVQFITVGGSLLT